MLLPYIKVFFKKRGLELVSPSHFMHDFWRKIYLTLYFINWLNFITWQPLFLEILSNICIVIICCSFPDVINFEINHGFLIKPSFYITKTQDKNVNISRTKKTFNMKWKLVFIISEVLSIVRNCLRPESGPLN